MHWCDLAKWYKYATTAGGQDYLQKTQQDIYTGSSAAALSETTDYFVDNNFGRSTGIKYGSTNLTIAYEYSSLGYMSYIKNAASGYVYRQVTGMDAFGNVTGSSLGVTTSSALGQAQSFHPATGQMLWNLVTKTINGAKVHELDYTYDGFSNLSSNRVTASNGMQNTESYFYDNLHRLTQSIRSYLSLTRSPDTVNYGFDEIGNILTKSDYTTGTMQYGNAARSAGGNAGPNGVHQASLKAGGTANYVYDNKGSMLSGDGRIIYYNEFSKPISITKGGVASVFSYGANQQRYLHVKSGIPGGAQTTYSIDKHLEIEIQGTRTTYRHYFDGVAILNKVVDSSTTWVLGFNLKDRLGSVVTLADENGDVIEHRSFDPYGKPRRGDFIDVAPSTIKDAIGFDPHAPISLDPLTDRGFTDHEHLDDQQIIHMNGRVYDYNIGRFTSVDPFIQDPTSSQSINPYSYIMNNPLAGTDPSGYTPEYFKRKRPVDQIGCLGVQCNAPGNPSIPGGGNPFAFSDSDGNSGSQDFESGDGATEADTSGRQDGLAGSGILESSQTDDSFFGFGQAGKFDGVSPAQFDVQIDNLTSGLLDAINFSLREKIRRSYTQGGAFLNNKRNFPDFWNRSMSTVTDPGNDGLRTMVIDHVLADPSFTIGAAVITGESIDGLVESLMQHSRYLQAPIFVSTSTVDRIFGGIEKVRILETFRITGGEGGQGTCVNTVTGTSCQ